MVGWWRSSLDVFQRRTRARAAKGVFTGFLAHASGEVLGLSIEGRRVAWGEDREDADAIVSLTMPR